MKAYVKNIYFSLAQPSIVCINIMCKMENTENTEAEVEATDWVHTQN